jgi:hypothetical protein
MISGLQMQINENNPHLVALIKYQGLRVKVGKAHEFVCGATR